MRAGDEVPEPCGVDGHGRRRKDEVDDRDRGRGVRVQVGKRARLGSWRVCEELAQAGEGDRADEV